jgi:hypothetical protein
VERVRLSNRVRHQLWRYYPQMRKLTSDLAAPWFLELSVIASTTVDLRSRPAQRYYGPLSSPHGLLGYLVSFPRPLGPSAAEFSFGLTQLTLGIALGGDTCRRSTQSAIAQTWQRKDVVVVDDGSSDGSAELARRFASKEVIFVSQENQGAAATRIHAFQLSQGEYIQYLDADHLPAPDKIERQLQAVGEGDCRKLFSASCDPLQLSDRSYNSAHSFGISGDAGDRG